MGGRKRKRCTSSNDGDGGSDSTARALPFRWRRAKHGTMDDGEEWVGPLRMVVVSQKECAAAANRKMAAAIKQRLDDALGEEQALFPNPNAVMVVGVWTAGPTDVLAGVVVCERLQRAWRMVDRRRGELEVGAIQHIVKSGQEVTSEALTRELSAVSAGSQQVGPASASAASSSSRGDVVEGRGSAAGDEGSSAHLSPPDDPSGGEDERGGVAGKEDAAADDTWARQTHVESLVDAGTGCICGISRVWVEPSLRRRAIASSLVTMARSSLVFGYDIPVEQTAFSQPTAAGKLLARAYTSREDFFVYA